MGHRVVLYLPFQGLGEFHKGLCAPRVERMRHLERTERKVDRRHFSGLTVFLFFSYAPCPVLSVQGIVPELSKQKSR